MLPPLRIDYEITGPAGSPFTVSLDGGVPFNHTANKQFYQPQVLLYTATNLGPGQHVVKVAYEPSQAGQIFAIDYANVYTAPSLKPAYVHYRSLALLAVDGITGLLVLRRREFIFFASADI